MTPRVSRNRHVSGVRFHSGMAVAFRQVQRRPSEVVLSAAAAEIVRRARVGRRWTQAQLAERAGISRSAVSKVECGRRPISIATIAAVADALDLRIELRLASQLLGLTASTRDVVHVRCAVFVERRLRRAGWLVAREVSVAASRGRLGWIDLLAFHVPTGRLLIIEVKTRLLDIGELERTLDWYRRTAIEAARGLGWDVRSASVAVLGIDSLEVSEVIRASRPVLDIGFPVRSRVLAAWLADPVTALPLPGRALALIDPISRSTRWLVAARSGGRRRPPAYQGYADAADRLARRR